MIKLSKLNIFLATAAGFLTMTAGLASAHSHIVESGDTLSELALEHNTTVEKLVQLNQIENPDLIYVGQVLNLGDVSKESGPVKPSAANSSVVTSSPAAESVQETSAPADYSAYSSSIVLSNGNTAGQVGMYAAHQIAATTGTDVSTWEYIIARESNGDPSAYNPSGASGLFQTMPFWGDTSTVEAQIQAALRAYYAQGFAAWGL